MNNIISVIMPVYNAEKFLREAIQSILNQSFKNFEFIIIDDGSTDRSIDIIKSYDDNRILLIKNHENKGIIYSLNKGIALAKGKYIARMDADDISYKNRFKIQVDFLEKNQQIALVGSHAAIVKQNRRTGVLFHVPTTDEEIRAKSLLHCPFIHPTIMGRTQIFKELLYSENFPLTEDYYLWIQIIQKYTVANLDKILLDYRVHNKNVSLDKEKENIKIESLRKLFQIQFNQLNIQVSSKEIATHLELCSTVYHDKIKSINDYKSIILWINRLEYKISSTQLYSNLILRQILANSWYSFCLRNAKHTLIPGFLFFIKTPLSNKKTFKEKLILFLFVLGQYKIVQPIFIFLKTRLLPFLTFKT